MTNIVPLSIEKLTSIFRTSPRDAQRIINREGTTIEFKESYNHGNMAQYFKAIASFANNIGGYIIFGVGNKPRRLIGLEGKSMKQFEELKVENFTKALLDYFSPEIRWDHCTFEYKNKSFGVIYVFPLSKKPCICKKNYDAMNKKYTLKEGDIYYRYGGRSERIRYSELSDIIEETRKAEEKQWLNFIQKTAKIGIENAGLLDIQSGELSGKSGTVMLDESLLNKISFIREGEFVEIKGSPTLKLIGEVQEISSGKVVVKEATRKVVKAIEPCDIVESFLRNEIVEEPAEYIKRICSATSANYPIYFYIKQANLTLEEAIKIVERTTVRCIAKSRLMERLAGRVVAQNKVTTLNSNASINKNKYRAQWLKENIPDRIEQLDHCLQSVLLLTDKEILEHYKYICSELLRIYHTEYEKTKSSTASNIRIAICRVDEAKYL